MFVAKFQKGTLRRFESALMIEMRKRIQEFDPNFLTPDRDLPVTLWIGFFFPPLAGTKPGIQAMPKTTRPDVDNMAKAVIDCMTKVGLLADDAQVYQMTLSKFINSKSETDREQGYIGIHLIYHYGDSMKKLSTQAKS